MSTILRVAVALALVTGAGAPLRAQGPTTGQTVPINGMDMYYEVRGNGEPLVLLHFFSGCGGIWEPHLERLAQHYRLIVPDLRGHGRSTNPGGEFTHRQSALDVLALLDHLGVSRFKAMGISTGGMTLIHIATRQPERITAMVLIGATSYFPEQARALMRATHPDSLSPQRREMYRRCAVRGDEQIRQLASQFNRFEDSYDDMNFTPPYLSTISAPTLIVHGDRDAYFPVEIPAETYRAIPRSYLWIVPNGGHIPIFGRWALQFQEVALEFLEGRWEEP